MNAAGDTLYLEIGPLMPFEMDDQPEPLYARGYRYTTPKKRPADPNAVYDYYFSLKQARLFHRSNKQQMGNIRYIHRFKKLPFTKAVLKGQPLPAVFDDYIKVGTGSAEKESTAGPW
ncbi:hypothetical protein [Spirosoma sp. KNUC1025]|uniref:hypothetical protein n=1 Tax=Spirosoma sp. KNUC1025 TaxID=2894082 RepID=UPI00386DBB67|nr:hypothetical protein LN737_08625 [Spirosoma sp. KNUC1025]